MFGNPGISKMDWAVLCISPPKKDGFEVIEIAQKVVEGTIFERFHKEGSLPFLILETSNSSSFSYSHLLGSGRLYEV